jgi:hypothetical protein
MATATAMVEDTAPTTPRVGGMPKHKPAKMTKIAAARQAHEGMMQAVKMMAGRERLKGHYGPQRMREYLEELAILECQGGKEYADEDTLKLDWLAGLSQTWNRGDFVTEGQVVIDGRGSRPRTRGKTREEVMRDVIFQFPDKILCRDAITRVRAEFDRFNKSYGTNWKLVERGRSIETYYEALHDAARQDRRRLLAGLGQGQGGWRWGWG